MIKNKALTFVIITYSVAQFVIYLGYFFLKTTLLYFNDTINIITTVLILTIWSLWSALFTKHNPTFASPTYTSAQRALFPFFPVLIQPSIDVKDPNLIIATAVNAPSYKTKIKFYLLFIFGFFSLFLDDLVKLSSADEQSLATQIIAFVLSAVATVNLFSLGAFLYNVWEVQRKYAKSQFPPVKKPW